MCILHFDASVCHDKRLLRWEQIFSLSVNAFEKKKKKEGRAGNREAGYSVLKKGTPWCRSAFQLRCLSALPNSVLILSALSSCIISQNYSKLFVLFFFFYRILDRN